MSGAHNILIVAEKCALANSGSHDLNADIYEALGYDVIRSPRTPGGIYWRYRGFGLLDRSPSRWEVQRDFSRSIDDAATLAGGWFKLEPDSLRGWRALGKMGAWRHAATPALAVCSAALTSIARQEQSHEA